MSEQEQGGPLGLPAQTANEAANSASPDTERLPAWDDPDWDSYLYAVDKHYRAEWHYAHPTGFSELDNEWGYDDDDDDDDDEGGEW